MEIVATRLAGVFVIGTTLRADHRGSFGRFFCEQELAPVLQGRCIVQINFSRTSMPGAIRGIHFQRPPHAEMKLVRCIRGRVRDVAVDLRAESSTFLQWHAEELSAESARMLVIPEGCAHGFQALEPDSELLYLHTAAYAPDAEGGVMFDDPALNLDWPLPVADISQRDLSHPLITHGFSGIVL
ncbi:MAG: rfbC [Rhodocyclales bacterium]|nr:rfbC [Rhodocyclales bacterium]